MSKITESVGDLHDTYLSDICDEHEAPNRLRRLVDRAHEDLNDYKQDKQAREYA